MDGSVVTSNQPAVTNKQQPPAGWNHGGRMPAQSMMTFRAPDRPVAAAVSTCVLHKILALRIELYYRGKPYLCIRYPTGRQKPFQAVHKLQNQLLGTPVQIVEGFGQFLYFLTLTAGKTIANCCKVVDFRLFV